MSVRYEIARREYAISMFRFDAWGNDTYSNVGKIKQLRKEIANLKIYGTANPGLFKLLFTKKSKQKEVKL